MLIHEGIGKNFGFLLVQVRKQLENTLRLLDTPNARLIKSIQDTDDYVDSLKSMIEKECYAYLGRQRINDERTVDLVRALNVMTANLERIADFSVNVARQMQRLRDSNVLQRFNYRAYIELALEGVTLIEPALNDRDSSRALRICQIEDLLDRQYGADLDQLIAGLRTGREVDQLVTVLFILHYFERMGDALLNIGEAAIFALLGERLKIQQYRVLDDAVGATSAAEPSLHEFELDSIWGTRSGVRVGTVGSPPQAPRPQKVLFKEGNAEKLEAERAALQRWGELAPGLAPAVVEYQKTEGDAALLLQYLDGVTFQELLLNGESEIVRKALGRITETLRTIWSNTLKAEPVNGSYLDQTGRRLDDVYRVHPSLVERDVRVGRFAVPVLSEMLTRAAAIEAACAAPFAVFIHGDFNLDNIIYNREADTLHFIDLHRSREMDYVQDVSVFLVSGFRLPVFVPRVRQRIERVAAEFLQFARTFAAEHADATFEVRLALGLARSLVTSTRFELKRSFARTMYRRALYLLNKLLAHDGRPWAEFRVPDSVLVY